VFSQVKTPFIKSSRILHTHSGLNPEASPRVVPQGLVPLIPSLLSLPRVNMNERHRSCHSPKTLRERSHLKGLIHAPTTPGRGPPLTARSNLEYKITRELETSHQDVPEMLAMLEAQDDTLVSLAASPVARGNSDRMRCRQVRGWFSLVEKCFPCRAKPLDIWNGAFYAAVRPLPAKVDKSRLPKGTFVPEREPDRSIDPEKVNMEEWREIGRRMCTKTPLYPGEQGPFNTRYNAL